MKVQVGSYFVDKARDSHREIHVSLDDLDAVGLFGDNWDEFSFEEKFNKLTAIADIMSVKWAVRRNLRFPDPANDEIAQISKDLR